MTHCLLYLLNRSYSPRISAFLSSSSFTHQLLLHILKSEAFDRICKPLARLSLFTVEKDCFFDDIQCLFFIGKNFA